MNKVAIVVDSTSDLTPEIYKEHNIEVISFYVNFNEKAYLDLVDMDLKKLFQKVKETNIHPRTATPSPGTFYEIYKKYLDQGYDVLYIGIGSKFSGGLQIAHTVASEFPSDRIFIVDSQNLSSGIGLLIMKAVKLREQGLSAREIKEELDNIVPRVRSQFVIDTLEYLHRGGRCSGTARIFGTLLKIHPIIRVVDGEMVVAKKPRGSFKKGIDVMLDYFVKDIDKVDKDCIFITHALSAENEKYIRDKVTPLVPDANILSTEAGSVIGTHCGPNTIGILYIVNE